MGVGLNLTGKLAKPAMLEDWFNGVWDWMSQTYPGLASGAALGQGPYDEFPRVLIRFHPAADPVRIWFPEEGLISVAADTVSAGPAYHLFLCDLLWKLSSRFQIGWDPETDDGHSNPTFFSGDTEQTYTEMFSWLASMASSADMMAGQGHFNLSMSPSYQFFSELPLITPMGPRSSQWIKEVSKNPQAGTDIFPWLKPGTGAEFLLNKAISHMWTDIRWCPPLGDGDAALMNVVVDLLKAAYKADPKLNYPFREWAELLAYLQIDDEMRELVFAEARKAPETESIGYRRREVRAMLDQGWSLLVPGNFSESAQFDPQTRNHTWQFGGEDFMIWFTTYPTYGDDAGNIMPVADAVLELDDLQKNLGKLVEEDTQGKIWRRTFITEPGDKGRAYRFSSIFLVPGRLALSHVFSEKESDLGIAVQFFRSIENNAGSSNRYVEQPKFPRVDLVLSS